MTRHTETINKTKQQSSRQLDKVFIGISIIIHQFFMASLTEKRLQGTLFCPTGKLCGATNRILATAASAIKEAY